MLDDAVRNNLLAALPADERERLLRDATIEPLSMRQVLHAADRDITDLYFPVVGVVSVVVRMSDGHAVEVTTIGNEGVVGLPVVLGVASTATEAFCQIPGRAVRLPAQRVVEGTPASPTLMRLLLRYTAAVLVQTGQHAACNRVHAIAQRCARWLLMTHDRVDGDVFPLTQDFLAEMLGVRRATVTVAAGMLQRAGFIEYRRGRVRVSNRAGLEGASCECYGVIRRIMTRVP